MYSSKAQDEVSLLLDFYQVSNFQFPVSKFPVFGGIFDKFRVSSFKFQIFDFRIIRVRLMEMNMSTVKPTEASLTSSFPEVWGWKYDRTGWMVYYFFGRTGPPMG